MGNFLMRQQGNSQWRPARLTQQVDPNERRPATEEADRARVEKSAPTRQQSRRAHLRITAPGKPAARRCSRRQGISAGVMGERDWRQLFIRGVSQSRPPSGLRSVLHPPGLKHERRAVLQGRAIQRHRRGTSRAPSILLLARGTYHVAARMHPDELIELTRARRCDQIRRRR
jgi:hypothetical protein